MPLLPTVMLRRVKTYSGMVSWLLLVSTILCWAGTSHVSETLGRIVPTLRRQTSVPLRLPSHIPALDQEPDLHANILSADKTGYVIVLAATPDCEGAHVCSFGALIGTTRPVKSIDFYSVSDRKRNSVTLRRGMKADFYRSECATYCDDALIVWTEHAFHYIVGLKGGSKAELIAAANSAIDAAVADGQSQ